MPDPLSTTVSVDCTGSAVIAILLAPESRELAMISVRMVSSILEGYASRKSSNRCSRSTRVSPMYHSVRSALCGEGPTVDGGAGEIKARARTSPGPPTGEVPVSNRFLANTSDQKEIEGLSLALAGDL